MRRHKQKHCGEDTGIVTSAVDPQRYAISNPSTTTTTTIPPPPPPPPCSLRAPPPPLPRAASLCSARTTEPAPARPSSRAYLAPAEILFIFFHRRSEDRRRALTSPCQVESEGRSGS
ncbi:hypothetical protein INR49_005515 [Caranx melampygus]|nr:hypothetical protein INR49_005515 [Caranx melampygus]